MSKPKKPQKQTPDKLQGRDFFQTPNYAVDLLVPYIPKRVKTVWECAAGKGKIVQRLEFNLYGVLSSDLVFNSDLDRQMNFLNETLDDLYLIDAIITNPPFSLKIKFYKKCLTYGKPFALLIPSDLAQWNLDAVRKDGAQWLIPIRRIDYITPRGLMGKDSQSQFHSGWLTWGFNLPDKMTVVDLPLNVKQNSSLI